MTECPIDELERKLSRIEFSEMWQDGCSTNWRVELLPPDGNMFPVGTAYVVVVNGEAAQLNFVFVADQWRQRGYGKELFRAIQQRWGNIQRTSAMDDLGEALQRSTSQDWTTQTEAG